MMTAEVMAIVASRLRFSVIRRTGQPHFPHASVSGGQRSRQRGQGMSFTRATHTSREGFATT